jgi:tetratricopeptide (TPR) repeat protein
VTEIPYKDFIRNYSLPKILVFLNRQSATGTVDVVAQGITRKIYIQDGNVIFATSTFEDERLGEILLKAGKISVQQYDESVEMLKRTGRRQGTMLVELGYLTPKDLFQGVKYQVKEIVENLFQLQDGMYEFIEGKIPSAEVITLNMSMANLIYEGVKKIDNWTKIRQEMPEVESVLKLSDDPLSLFQEIELSAQDRGILSLVDGQRTINKVIDDSGLTSLEVLKTLYVLWSIGMITERGGEGIDLSVGEILKPAEEMDESLKAKVSEIHGKLGSSSPFELLEVGEDADPELIKQNYYRLTKEFHPDRHRSISDPALKSKVSDIFNAITEAFNTLSAQKPAAPEEDRAFREPAITEEDMAFREPAITEEDMAFKEPAITEKDMASQAEELTRMGIEELKGGNFSMAAEFLGEALKIKPDKAVNWNYLSLALMKMPERLKEAEDALLKAIELNPKQSKYYTNLGVLYIKSKRTGDARAMFQKVVELDPKNEKAKKALSQLGG